MIGNRLCSSPNDDEESVVPFARFFFYFVARWSVLCRHARSRSLLMLCNTLYLHPQCTINEKGCQATIDRNESSSSHDCEVDLRVPAGARHPC